MTEAETIARNAMDELYAAMRERGVVTTMMYDFGVPFVAKRIESLLSENKRLRDVLSMIANGHVKQQELLPYINDNLARIDAR